MVIQNNNILIFEGDAELSAQIANTLSARHTLKVFDETTNVVSSEDDEHKRSFYCVPYLIEFLKQTRTSAILFRQFLHWIDSCEEQYARHACDELDKILAKNDCIIVYVKHNIEDNLNKKYIDFLNDARCRTVVVDEIDDYVCATKIESFIEMHNKLRNYRDSFYKKLISFGRFDGSKILFFAERDTDYLTKLGLEKRICAESGKEFEDEYRAQAKSSDISKFIDLILDEAQINRFETSYTTLVKSDIEKLSQFDIDILKLELKLLRPKSIVSFSKKLTDSISSLDETKSSVIKTIKLPIVYSDSVIYDAANEIRTLAQTDI